MTGIERLCELGGHYAGNGDPIVKMVGHELLSIADQIEREHVSRMRVLAVVTEMERLIHGHEVRGNNLVARWARELRDALKSYTSDGRDAQKPSCAEPADVADVTSEAQKVTRDPAEDVSMSAYDLLPADEREAIAWMREHGGLSHVKDIYHDLRAVVEYLGIEWSESELHGLMDALDRLLMTDDALRGTIDETCARLGVEHTGELVQDAQAIWREIGALRSRLDESVPRSYADRRIAARQRQIDESHAALSRRNARIAELETERDELRAQVDAMRPRLMPPGLSWPRWDDCKPITYDDSPENTIGIFLALDGSCWAHMTDVPDTWHETYECLVRPAPKVLDADGVETRLNDKVYDRDGIEWRVNVIPEPGDPSKIQLYRHVEPQGSRFIAVDPQTITHRAPVLAADGKPLREGETAYGTGREQHEYVVRDLCERGTGFGRFSILCHDVTDDKDCFCDPSQLTHERPDSYDALWEDIENCAVGYSEFMRRAEALAGDA